jgi:hypothetical protein
VLSAAIYKSKYLNSLTNQNRQNIYYKGGYMKVYLKGWHNFPKRIDDHILAYYACNNVVILRKPAIRSILPQNIEIKNNQPYLCALWREMPLMVKTLFGDYAKVYKVHSMQKRAQGVSSFSVFLSFVYRVQQRYKVLIKNMCTDFIINIFKQYNSLRKLMKENLLLALNLRIFSQNTSLIFVIKEPIDKGTSRQNYVNDNKSEIFSMNKSIQFALSRGKNEKHIKKRELAPFKTENLE